METATHNIRFAQYKDIENILEFIQKYWKSNHIFVKSPEFFKYQHSDHDRINFVIAGNDKVETIDAVLGFIKYSDEIHPDVCLALWKVAKRNDNPVLGLQLLEFIKEALQPRSISCCDITEGLLSVCKYLGYETGKLKHYYLLNDQLEKYTIARIPNQYSVRRGVNNKKNYLLINIPSFHELKTIFHFERYNKRMPYKDEWYIKKRYFEHPAYNYLTYGIKKGEEIESILIMREIVVNNSRILRIVDFIGIDDDLLGIANELCRIIYKYHYEYIDFYLHGIDSKILSNAGFALKDISKEIVIPNHFEPFEQKNCDIYFFASQQNNFYMFKADGDQDRPNVLMNN